MLSYRIGPALYWLSFALGTAALPACQPPDTRHITPNVTLRRDPDSTYSVTLRRDEDQAYWTTVTHVQQLAWSGDRNVLVYGRSSQQTGWIYVYDCGDGVPELMKSWGTYSHKEFIKRSRELGIQDMKPMPAAAAWALLR